MHFLDYSRSYSQYGVLRICTFDTFYHGYFPGAGIPFLFSFGCTTPFYSTFHSLRSDPHAFARRGGIPARFPACLLLPIAAGTDACRLLYAKPAVELPVMTLHAGLFGLPLAPFCRFNVKRVWLACRLHAGTTGRICLLAPCGHVLPKPVASCSTFSLLLLAEVTIIFRRKDSMRSGAA